MLALIRHFIHHPVQHTVIFFFNNAEEEGLMGAGSFMGAPPNSSEDLGDGHPWKKFIRAVINLGKQISYCVLNPVQQNGRHTVIEWSFLLLTPNPPLLFHGLL